MDTKTAFNQLLDKYKKLKAENEQLKKLLAIEQKHLTTTEPCSITTLNTE